MKALAHLCFVVRDLDAAVAFYCERLGLTHAFDFVNAEGERFGVYLHVGGRGFLELFRGEPRPIEGGSYQHLCLEVDEIDALVADLRAHGVEVTDPYLADDASYQSWLADPDGNRIELHCYTAESRQAPWLR